MEPPERWARRSEQVFRAIAALILASAAIGATASATQPKPPSSDTLLSNSPWWEKITVTMSGDGEAQSCLYQSSLKPGAVKSCDVDASPESISDSHASPAAKEEYTRITFERRFTPGASPAKSGLQAGDRLIGGQMMALAIDARGAVKGCKIVAVSGEMQPDYGCAEATAERFDAGAPRGPERDGYMTILVYGHSEHMV